MSIFKQDGSFLFQEGTIKDIASSTISSTTGKEPSEIKDDWNAASGKFDKAKVAVDDVVTPLGNKAAEAEGKIKENIVDGRSIIARARNSVMEFPVYIVQTCRVNEAHILAKFFEKVYVDYVQIVLSTIQIINEDEANEMVFLQRYHSNIKEAADAFVNKYYEPIDECDEMIQHSLFHKQQITENSWVEFRWVPESDPLILAENARLINDPLTGLSTYLIEKNETVENGREETTTRNHQVKVLSDQDLRDMAANEAKLSPAEKRAANMKIDKNSTKEEKDSHEAAIKKIDDEVENLKERIKNGQMDGPAGRYGYANGKYTFEDISTTTSTKSKVTNNIGEGLRAPAVLKDGDLKKLNGMEPWKIECSFHVKDKNGRIDNVVHYIVGIKTVLHLVRTQDLAEDLEELVTGNIRKLRKVRYKTGEIKLVDYLLNIKGIKADAAKNINHNKRWINTQKRLAEYNKLHGTLFKKSAVKISSMTNAKIPFPNGTLILTQSDVSMLASQTGIDLSEVGNAVKLSKSLFLIAFAIIDQAAGSMRVLFDGKGSWDVQSLASIEADMAKTDNSKLMNELNRMVNRGGN